MYEKGHQLEYKKLNFETAAKNIKYKFNRPFFVNIASTGNLEFDI